MNRKTGSGKGGFIFALLIVGCIIFAFINMFSSDEGSDYSSAYDISNDSTETVTYDIPQNRNMYNRLNASGKELYKTLREELINGKLDVVFSDYGDEETFFANLRQAYTAVYFDFPEFFWLNQGWAAYYTEVNGSTGILLKMECYDYWKYTADKNKCIQQVMAEAGKIAAKAQEYDSDYDKMKYVHDYLVVNAEYDYVCLNEMNNTVQRASSQQSHSVYGALLNKVCVCDGYSKTFQLIMSILGIECEYWQGTAGGGHAWNYVVIDGQEYWMDITWDENELAYEDGTLVSPYGAQYNYFCVDDEFFYKSHTPEEPFKLPVCDSDKYNYFVYNESYFEKYDFQKACDGIAEQNGNQIIQLKFATYAELEKAVADIIENKKWKEIPVVKDKVVYYNSSAAESRDFVLSLYLQ